LYATHVEESTKDKFPSLMEFLVLQESVDVFEELLGFPPKRDMNVYIDLVLRVSLVSNTRYKMNTL
jgi:hypothetical protein